ARLSSLWEEKIRKSDEADFKRDEARRKRDELKDQLDNEFVPGLKEAANEEWEIKKEYDKANP
ncbi:hypothetical protein, partial [Candidatus Liberibacter solanacearum]|uniref:hypothetical protein n=1 Tax=Candidatus Liberibacter solanacearum TaxID=556287 RepID=UPI00054FD9C0